MRFFMARSMIFIPRPIASSSEMPDGLLSWSMSAFFSACRLGPHSRLLFPPLLPQPVRFFASPPWRRATTCQVLFVMLCSINRQIRRRPHMFSRAFRSGALDMLMTPVKGRLSSKIRKIAHAADKANRQRHVTTVTLRGENRLKLANMSVSQNARTARNGLGTRFSDSTNSKKRVCATSLLTCTARDWSERWTLSCGDSF